MDKHTVSMYFVRAAVARLAPAARARVLRASAIAPELAGMPQARVTAESFAALWLATARELDDEFFGLDSRRMKVGSFALLCQAVLASGTLERALKAILRGFRLFFDDIEAELALDAGAAVIVIRNRIVDPCDRQFAEETLLVMVHGLMCWLVGRRIPLVSAAFNGVPPAHAAEYGVMFSEHLAFEARATEVRFCAEHLGLAVVQDADALRRFLRTAPQSVFLKYRNEDSWSARLRRRLRSCVGDAHWPRLDELAREFHLTLTTLRRRLEAEGTSYQDIKDQMRRDAAIDQLCHSAHSVAEIAAMLGFKEPSAFHRAFRKWLGVRPGEYRRRLGTRPDRPA